MILTGPQIVRCLERGDIRIAPFDRSLVNPASVDLRLGPGVFTYDAQNGGVLDPFDVNEGVDGVIGQGRDGDEILIHSGRLYLMHTLERVWAHNLVPVLDGKSSLGRLGVSVHQTAGYGDPGFEGNYTLEVTCVMPTRLRVGMRIAQIRFHTTVGDLQTYAGHYRGGQASGAVRARPLEP
jgi:dCTP deaminase